MAKFYYKGSHSDPVRRTILVTESSEDYISGYEVRVGNIIREPADAPIKSYARSRIAKVRGWSATRRRHCLVIKTSGAEKSTLRRLRLYDYLFNGP